MNPEGLHAKLAIGCSTPRVASRVDASKITCPVLVIAGGLDRITPASVVRQVAIKYRQVSTYEEFENHAHWVLAEPDWQEIAAYVDGWLIQLNSRS